MLVHPLEIQELNYELVFHYLAPSLANLSHLSTIPESGFSALLSITADDNETSYHFLDFGESMTYKTVLQVLHQSMLASRHFHVTW